MKLTDGMFHKMFEKIAAEYPEIENEHYIIDIGAARIANDPCRFDVIVTLNLYGDIISDIAADVAGSVGLGGSSNIGQDFAMFEAIHGSAPDIAGKDIANPSGLLNGACMMLVHLGQASVAEKIQNAMLKTLEDGIHTGDIYKEGLSKQKVGTNAFAAAVIQRLGQEPSLFKAVKLNHDAKPIQIKLSPVTPATKELVGVDVFINWDKEGRNPDILGKQVLEAAGDILKLKIISNRGVGVYPGGKSETFCSDHWRCRFTAADNSVITFNEVLTLQQFLHEKGFDVIKTENLYFFNGERGYTLGQGEQ